MIERLRDLGLAAAAAGCIVVLTGNPAAAQTSTLATLPEEPPEVSLYRLGPVIVNPKLTIPEIGHDSNAFNDSTAPKEDFVIKMTPEVDFFTDMGVVRIAVKSAMALTYFHRYDSERSMAEQVRGRLMARFSRFRPWAGGASLRSNERTTEIDARATRSDREVAGGIQFELTPVAAVIVSASRLDVEYSATASYRGLALAPELNRTTDIVSAALRFEATPFTTVNVLGYGGRDDFAFATTRDADIRGGEVEVSFSPEAIIRGRLAVGFRQHDFDDPTLKTFRGVTGRGSMTSLLAWRAMVGVDYIRDVQYSFDRRESYYIENGANVAYTQRIGGPFDVQARVGRSGLRYGPRSTPGHTETVRSYQGGIGYSLEGGSRFGMNYELAERVGGTSAERDFSRRRVFGSFTYEFWK